MNALIYSFWAMLNEMSPFCCLALLWLECYMRLCQIKCIQNIWQATDGEQLLRLLHLASRCRCVHAVCCPRQCRCAIMVLRGHRQLHF